MVEIDDYKERLRPPSSILVTGSLGTIGKAIFEEVKFSSYYRGDSFWGLDKKCGVDISDFEDLNTIIKEMHLDYIIHLAANPDPEAKWASVKKNNIIGTRNVYEVARLNKIKRVVF